MPNTVRKGVRIRPRRFRVPAGAEIRLDLPQRVRKRDSTPHGKSHRQIVPQS